MRRGLLLIMAIVMAGLTTFLFYKYVQGAGARQAVAPVSMRTVVVAKEVIPNNTLITDKMITLKQVPATTLQPDAETSLDQVTGKWSLVAMQPDEMVLTHHIVSADQATLLSYKIKPEDRAITITATRIADTVANLVQPGDHVDVLLNAKTGASVITTDILVLAVDQQMTAKPSEQDSAKTATTKAPYTMTTLEVSPADAIKMVNAEQKGDLTLLLRSTQPGS